MGSAPLGAHWLVRPGVGRRAEAETILVAHMRGHTWAVDLDRWRRGRCSFRFGAAALRLRDSVQSLGSLLPATTAVAHVFELCVVGAAAPGIGTAAPGYSEVNVKHCADITEPISQPKKRKRKSQMTEENEDSECDEEKDLQEDVQSACSDGSEISVDTDIDTDVDLEAKELKKALAESLDAFQGAAAPGAAAPEDTPDAPPEEPDADCAQEKHRHPTGTWTIWSNPWFYVIQTPGWTDMKCHMYGSFRREGCMGTVLSTKTLTPHHYGDSSIDPWRTMLLLRSWALWRARCLGWHTERECRLRETQRQAEWIKQELRRAHGGNPSAPLSHDEKAHKLFLTWIPREVTELLTLRGAAAAA